MQTFSLASKNKVGRRILLPTDGPWLPESLSVVRTHPLLGGLEGSYMESGLVKVPAFTYPAHSILAWSSVKSVYSFSNGLSDIRSIQHTPTGLCLQLCIDDAYVVDVEIYYDYENNSKTDIKYRADVLDAYTRTTIATRKQLSESDIDTFVVGVCGVRFLLTPPSAEIPDTLQDVVTPTNIYTSLRPMPRSQFVQRFLDKVKQCMVGNVVSPVWEGQDRLTSAPLPFVGLPMFVDGGV